MAYPVKSKKVKEKKEIEHNPYVYPFNDRGNLNEVKNTDLWKLHDKAIKNPESLTRKEKNEIYDKIRNSSYGNGHGVALMGVMFDFKPILKKFYVERDYWGVGIVYAPDKMSIRNNRFEKNSIKRINEAQS
jgi:hypothetical protein